ncbi:hypothetical protein [Brucella cytisi]|nr:hypothetical protein [Brucella cytisi]
MQEVFMVLIGSLALICPARGAPQATPSDLHRHQQNHPPFVITKKLGIAVDIEIMSGLIVITNRQGEQQ